VSGVQIGSFGAILNAGGLGYVGEGSRLTIIATLSYAYITPLATGATLASVVVSELVWLISTIGTI
jgi:hypothetical protein